MDANMLVLMPYAPSDFRYPNCFTWKHNASVNQAGLRRLIGDAAFEIFAEAVWTEDVIDQVTWMTIEHQARAAYYLAARGERDLAVLIEAAKHALERSEAAVQV